MWFERIKRFYDNGFWTKEQVADGVRTGHITEEEYKKITEEEFDA